MELGTIEDAWPEYSSWLTEKVQPPPESMFIYEAEFLLAGCCIYPGESHMNVAHVTTSPKLSEESEARVLRYMLSGLETFQKMTHRLMLIDMVWVTDSNGLLVRRLPALMGMHMVPETLFVPAAVDEGQHSGEDSGAAKNALEVAEPTTAAPEVESVPKKPRKARAKRVKAGKGKVKS